MTRCKHCCDPARCSFCFEVAEERARCLAIFRRWGTHPQPGRPYCRMAEADAAIEAGTTLEELEAQLVEAMERKPA